jgi:hypothetical protein
MPKTKIYTRRAIDKYKDKNKEKIKTYALEYYYKRKAEDNREPQFKIFCKLYGIL